MSYLIFYALNSIKKTYVSYINTWNNNNKKKKTELALNDIRINIVQTQHGL